MVKVIARAFRWRVCDFGPASFGVRPDQTNPQRVFAHKMSLLATVDIAKCAEAGQRDLHVRRHCARSARAGLT